MRRFERGIERGKIGTAGRLQRRQFAFDAGHLGFETRGALAVLAGGALELIAARGQVGEFGGEFGEHRFGGGEFGVGFRDLGVDAAAAAGALLQFGADGFFFGGKARQRFLRVGGEALFALGVGGELHQTQIELGDAILGAGFFAVEFLRRDVQTMQRRAGARFGFAQFRQRGGGVGLTL